MVDTYERILRELSRKLPNKEDVELLETLISSLREGGQEQAEKTIKSMIKNLGDAN